MRIPIVLAVCYLFLASGVNAQLLQSSGSLAVGPAFEISIPAKALADRVGTGFGGSARLQYVAFEDIALVVTAGYLAWADKDVPNITSKVNALELLAGPKFGFGSGAYAGFDLGIYLAHKEFSVSSGDPLKRDETKAMAGVFLGYEFSGFDVGVKYFPFDADYTNVMVSIGYWFAL